MHEVARYYRNMIKIFYSQHYRHIYTDFDVTGYLIPKGWKVMMWFRAIHLDPEIYPNPKEFNPERWNVSCKDLVDTFELNKLIYGSMCFCTLMGSL